MGIFEAIGAALLAVVMAFLYGRSKGKVDERQKRDAEYLETRKRMDESYVGDDPAVARDWLRERGKR